METNSNEYLHRFYEALDFLPEEERVDAVREIESSIADGVANGQPVAVILARLGDPRKLAKAYQSEYMMGWGQSKRLSLKSLWQMVTFYCTTGLLSIMIIPVLAIIAYGFGFCAVVVLLAGVIRSFGVSWINMSLGNGYEVPYAWSIPYAILASLLIGGIAFICRKYLLIYMKYLSRQYSRLIPR